MITYTATADLVQRRLVMRFEEDNVGRCYIRMQDGVAGILIILDEDIPSHLHTAIAVRYMHLVSDKIDDICVNVLQKTNHFVKDTDFIEVWNKQDGFIGL